MYNAEHHKTSDIAEKLSSLQTKLGKDLPELEERKDLNQELASLMDRYDISAELLDDDARALLLFGIAAHSLDLKDYNDEDEIVRDALALLAHGFSAEFTDTHNELSQANDQGYERVTMVYDKYTDPRLSAELQGLMSNGEYVGETQERMGIDATNEDPYVVRVLTTASDHQLLGLDAPRVTEADTSRAELDEKIELAADVRSWKQGLKERSDTFAKELGRDSSFADAWVTEINGVRNLCISMALAEKLLDRNVTTNTSFYDERMYQNDLSTLRHEYTHTQGGLNLGGETVFGISLEERRAEYFSGDKLGYQDVKNMFNSYYVLTGNRLDDLFLKTKGGEQAEVYSEIASNIGLANMIEFLAAVPRNYLDDDSCPKALKRLASRTGDYNECFGRILEQKMVDPQEAVAIEERITERAKQVVEVVSQPGSVIDVDSVQEYQARNGNTLISGLVCDKARYILASISK